MKKALIVGINHYSNAPQLHGCVSDAQAVNRVLSRHEDGSVNFHVKLCLAGSECDAIGRSELRDAIQELFAGDSEIALLYFSGHGHAEATGGYLCDSVCQDGNDGLALADVLTFADNSRAQNRVIVLDCCYSGTAGNRAGAQAEAVLREGTTILTASAEDQYANEEDGSGVFTTLFVDALNGAAGNLVGDVTPGSVYAHIDQSLGAWKQRPVFKTNVKSFVSLRKVAAPIALSALRRITEFFPERGYQFNLDPSFEPEMSGRPTNAPAPNSANTEKFAILQSFNRVALVVPVGAPHMWHAAMQSKSCKLTVLGEHYRRLVSEGLI